jgi:hypothetical protein
MLSLVDLIDAGTLSLDMAAEMAHAVAGGGSLLTAAGPGGVGKTTLMGALLAFLSPGTEIVTIEGPRTIERLPAPSPEAPKCLMVHEIGSGHWYGYLWGPAVGRYVDAGRAPGRSLASNLHAETYEEAVDQLVGLDVSAEGLGAIDLVAFMASRGSKRRVTTVWRADASGGHACAWRWAPENDRFDRVAAAPPAATEAEVARYRGFLHRALADRVFRIERLRQRAVTELFQDR